VQRTVCSLDRLHDIEEQELLQGGQELQSAQSDALAAGLQAEQALQSIAPAEEGDDIEVREDRAEDGEKENDPPVGAYRKGMDDGWDGVKACGKRMLVALPEDTPVDRDDFDDDLREPLRQIQLR